MGHTDDLQGPSRLRFVVNEATILAVGVAALLVIFGLVLSVIARMLGWSMCCQ